MALPPDLQQLAASTNGFHKQLEGDVRDLHTNVQSVLQATALLHNQQESLRAELGLTPTLDSGEGANGLGLRARLDHLYGLLWAVHASSETQGIVASRLDHVMDVLSGIQNKPEPPPPISK